MALRHVRRHWKKYVFGQCVGLYGTSYLIRKYRERNIVRDYCNRAKRFGEERAAMLDRQKKIMVFLNRTADNSNAKINFTKYAAPLLHLSGLDVTVVESEYQGHIQMLMYYVDRKTEGIVIAGGDGTVMEVMTGLMRRPDAEVIKSMVLGVLPLGKENRSFNRLFEPVDGASQARRIGEATMKILHGATKQTSVMEIQPEAGQPQYALSSVQWGVFKDAFQNRNRFWLLGKLRLLASYLNTVTRGWPGEQMSSLWGFPAPGDPETRVTEGDESEGIAAFKISPTAEDSLSLTTWPLSLLPKSAFLKHGFELTLKGGRGEELPGEQRTGPECRLTAPTNRTGQVSVDGEQYEPVNMKITLKHITVYS